MPFDIRPWGYSYAEARAFLEAIGEGRSRVLCQSRTNLRCVLSAALRSLSRVGVVVADDAGAHLEGGSAPEGALGANLCADPHGDP